MVVFVIISYRIINEYEFLKRMGKNDIFLGSLVRVSYVSLVYYLVFMFNCAFPSRLSDQSKIDES